MKLLKKGFCPVVFFIKLKYYVSFFLAILFVGTTSVNAADRDTLKSERPYIFSGYVQYGKVLATNPYLRQANSSEDRFIEYGAMSIQALTQTTGKQLWEQNYGYPRYGIGFYKAAFFDNKNFGSPFAFYGDFKAPFKRWNRFSIDYEAGLGLTFNWKSFNPVKNDYNPSLGAKESVFIDLGVNFSYSLSSHFDLEFGYSFTHFSNGALKSPNLGLNTFSPKLTLEYNIDRFVPPSKRPILPPFVKHSSLDFAIFGGAKNVIYSGNNVDTAMKYKGVYYPVYGFSTVISRQLTYKSKVGIGMALIYDGSYNSFIFVENGKLEEFDGFNRNKLSVSIFPSYELVIDKLTVVIQPGFDIFRTPSINKKPITYQRLGVHYQVSRDLFVGLSLHAYSYHVSDFIEWTVGYHLPFTKQR